MTEPVRHPEDGRGGVLVPWSWYDEHAPYPHRTLGARWLIRYREGICEQRSLGSDRWRPVDPDVPWREFVMRHEFDIERRGAECIVVTEGVAVFYLREPAPEPAP